MIRPQELDAHLPSARTSYLQRARHENRVVVGVPADDDVQRTRRARLEIRTTLEQTSRRADVQQARLCRTRQHAYRIVGGEHGFEARARGIHAGLKPWPTIHAVPHRATE